MAEPLVQSNSRILMGAPQIAGTRIGVELTPNKIVAGEECTQNLKAPPGLTNDAIDAIIRTSERS